MKTRILITIFASFLLTNCSFSISSGDSETYLNPEQVPSAARNAFKSKYPNRQAKWQQKDYGYEAIFMENGIEHEAEFTDNGRWLETEVEVEEQQFSQRVLERIRREYPNYEITKREIETTPNGTFYEVEIEHGEKEYELYFDKNANLVRNANEDA